MTAVNGMRGRRNGSRSSDIYIKPEHDDERKEGRMMITTPDSKNEGGRYSNSKKEKRFVSTVTTSTTVSSLLSSIKEEERHQSVPPDDDAVEDETEWKEWIDLGVSPMELRPEFSLTMGQCFNWKRKQASSLSPTKPSEEVMDWVGVLGRNVYVIRQTPQSTLVRRIAGREKQGGDPDEEKRRMIESLKDYFQVKVPLASLYNQWSQVDDRMKEIAVNIPGVRVLRQEPVECLFSFICSSNNNIPRIALMLDRLRTTYGECLAEGYHSFPSIDRLAKTTEQELRDLGLGYRAKYIMETAKMLQELGRDGYLLGLRGKGRFEVQEALLNFPGVGRKVADCVALFSLDQAGAIPVDVHVWRIACRDYDSQLKHTKSLTPTIYETVGDLFRDRFGPRAGWAHSLLFAAELPNYRIRLPLAIQQEMEAFKKGESEEKATNRAEKRRKKEEKTATAMMVEENGGGESAGGKIKRLQKAAIKPEEGNEGKEGEEQATLAIAKMKRSKTGISIKREERKRMKVKKPGEAECGDDNDMILDTLDTAD